MAVYGLLYSPGGDESDPDRIPGTGHPGRRRDGAAPAAADDPAGDRTAAERLSESQPAAGYGFLYHGAGLRRRPGDPGRAGAGGRGVQIGGFCHRGRIPGWYQHSCVRMPDPGCVKPLNEKLAILPFLLIYCWILLVW